MKKELFFLLLFTCNYVVSVWRDFLFLLVFEIGCVILSWHSLGLPYNHFAFETIKSSGNSSGLSPQVILNYCLCQGVTSGVVLCVLCFGVSFCTVSPSVCLDDIY